MTVLRLLMVDPAELNFDDCCLPNDESQSSLTDLEAFLDRSALRMGNITRKLDSGMCATTDKGDDVEEGCIEPNESIKDPNCCCG